jgi:hypothetical protein
MTDHPDWPELPYSEWAPTRRTLHMATQMIGKAKLAMAPPLPEWLNARLFLDSRGFVTGPLPYGSKTVSMGIDVFESALWIASGDGRPATLPLAPDRCVAVVWSDFQAALAELGIVLDLWEKPQEVADATPFSQDRRDCTFAAEQAQRFHRILSAPTACSRSSGRSSSDAPACSSGGAALTSLCCCSPAARSARRTTEGTSCATTWMRST